MVKINIVTDTKCLLLSPHADDEVIGCGGLLLKYGKHFDVICISGSGLAYQDITAQQRLNLRINEFNNVMKYLNVNKFKIFDSYGTIPEIYAQTTNRKLTDYIEGFDVSTYDYIFVPYVFDTHAEHRYTSNVIAKKLLKKYGNSKSYIVFYEVWTPLLRPNYFEDISDIITKKIELINMYPSQLVKINYSEHIAGLNSYRGMLCGMKYAESYQIVSLNKFIYAPNIFYLFVS